MRHPHATALLLSLIAASQLAAASATDSVSMYAYPSGWVRLEGDSAVYQIVVIFDPAKGRVELNVPSEPARGISIKLDPKSGRPLTGVLTSTLVITTDGTTLPGLYSFDVVAVVGGESKRVNVNLKVVPQTPDGASMVLYDFYSKILSPVYWNNVGNYALALFSSDFGSSFTNPVSLLKKFAAEAAGVGSLTAAETLAKEGISMASYISATQVAYTLSSVISGEVTPDDRWEVRELKEISSLIERGDRSAAMSRIDSLLTKVRGWSQKVELLKEDGFTVTERSKASVKNILLSLERFLGEEKRRLSSGGSVPSIVLAMDTSGSMNDIWAGERKIDSAKRSAISLLRTLTFGERVALVSFDTSARLELPLTSDRTRMIEAIEGLSAGGETNMGDALVKSLDELRGAEGSVKAVVFFTDGRLNRGMGEEEVLSGPVKLARTMGVRIYTIGYGDPAELNEGFLRKIAEETGGKYYYAKDIFNLENDLMEAGQLASGMNLTLKQTGKIGQGERKTFSLIISKLFSEVRFILNWRGSDLDLKVFDQNGNLMNGAPNAQYSGDTRPEYLVMKNALPGLYRVEVYGRDVSGEEEYVLWIFTSLTYREVSGGGAVLRGSTQPTETAQTTISREEGDVIWAPALGIAISAAIILSALYYRYGRAPGYYLADPSGRQILRTSDKDRIYGREDFPMLDPDKARYISRRIKGGQFRIFRSGREYYIVDTSSANPTIVDGVVIRGKGPVKLSNGSRIQVEEALDLLFYYS